MIRPPAAASSRYLNLGCGSRIHQAWLNLDVMPAVAGVAAWEVARGIPLPDGHCSAVYHSHLLEHLRRDAVLPFLGECRRVLAPGGVLRVVVPDLENACRAYLAALEAADAGDAHAESDHEWMTLELVDQLARERSGGEMLAFLRRAPLPNPDFVRARLGEEATAILDPGPRLRRAWSVRLRFGLGALRGAYERITAGLFLGASAARALALGRFRLSGEAHQWMYDRHALARLLRQAGFATPVLQSAQSSFISGWPSFHLDVTADGRVARPNSIYMEAVKEA